MIAVVHSVIISAGAYPPQKMQPEEKERHRGLGSSDNYPI